MLAPHHAMKMNNSAPTPTPNFILLIENDNLLSSSSTVSLLPLDTTGKFSASLPQPLYQAQYSKSKPQVTVSRISRFPGVNFTANSETTGHSSSSPFVYSHSIPHHQPNPPLVSPNASTPALPPPFPPPPPYYAPPPPQYSISHQQLQPHPHLQAQNPQQNHRQLPTVGTVIIHDSTSKIDISFPDPHNENQSVKFPLKRKDLLSSGHSFTLPLPPPSSHTEEDKEGKAEEKETETEEVAAAGVKKQRFRWQSLSKTSAIMKSNVDLELVLASSSSRASSSSSSSSSENDERENREGGKIVIAKFKKHFSTSKLNVQTNAANNSAAPKGGLDGLIDGAVNRIPLKPGAKKHVERTTKFLSKTKKKAIPPRAIEIYLPPASLNEQLMDVIVISGLAVAEYRRISDDEWGEAEDIVEEVMGWVFG